MRVEGGGIAGKSFGSSSPMRNITGDDEEVCENDL
jgi:hypothetical protein